MTVQHYLTAYPAVYGQFTQAIPPQIAAVPAQREGKKIKEALSQTEHFNPLHYLSLPPSPTLKVFNFTCCFDFGVIQ